MDMMGLYIFSLQYLLASLSFPPVKSFNIDIQHKYLEYTIDNKLSQFGYAVSLINNKNTPLIVGAPTYNDSRGAIFKCRVDEQKCSKVIFDHGPGSHSESQTAGQRFGFSLSQVGKRLMACAPKFNIMEWTKKTGYISQPVGKCSVFDKDMKLSYNEIPCEDKTKLKNNKLLSGMGYCLAGISSTGLPVENNEPVYILGTPGTRHLAGLMFAVYSDNGHDTWDPISAGEKPEEFKRNSYIGYAVSAGNVIDKEIYGDVLAGAPRGNRMTGHALLYKLHKSKYDFTWKVNISNPHEQLGSYFGGAVCVADLNADKTDDVLIGVPYYSKVQDEGRVYIYENKGDPNSNTSRGSGPKYGGLELSSVFLEGDGKIGGRFGTTIANIGDINKDSFTDIAIGAPGGDDGAVFIYNGGKFGLRTTYSQVIYASSILSTPKGFGISIASGVDVDGNSYNDLAIGAHLEGKAYIFKSRPIIHLISSLTTNVSIIPSEEKQINCYWKKVGYQCISSNLNLRYFGEGTPDSLEMEVTISLDDSSLVRKRAYMVDEIKKKLVSKTKRKIVLRKNVTEIIYTKVYIAIGINVDMLKHIALVSSFKAHHNQTKCKNTPCGILDEYSSKSASTDVSYEHRCGEDDVCNADLRTESSILFPNNPRVKKVIYGVVYDFIINSTITNLGEPAYQAKMTTLFNSDLHVDRVEINGKANPLWEDVRTKNGEQLLSFPLANPFHEHSAINVIVKFAVLKPKPSKTSYTFTMKATSIGRESNPVDNAKVILVEAKVEACVRMNGEVSPAYIMSNPVATELPKVTAPASHIGTPIIYTFNVENHGKVPAESLIAEINIVTKLNDVWLMCISGITVDDILCEDISNKSTCKAILDKPHIYENVGVEKADEKKLSCTNAACETFRCNIKKIQQGKAAIIKITSRLLDANLVKVRKTYLETSAVTQLKDMGLFVPRKECSMKGNALLTIEIPMEKGDAQQIPIWIIILAAIVAIFLLAIIIFVLYKKKFFHRKRHFKEEDEPLNEEEDEEEE